VFSVTDSRNIILKFTIRYCVKSRMVEVLLVMQYKVWNKALLPDGPLVAMK
jgi:hypothetical protein